MVVIDQAVTITKMEKNDAARPLYILLEFGS